MQSLYLLIPISLIFIAVAIRVFFWAVNSGQYDDLDTEGERILFDQDDLLEGSRTKSRDKSRDKSRGEKNADQDAPL